MCICARVRVHVLIRAFVCACVRVCVRARARACVRARARAREGVCMREVKEV